MQVVLIVGTGRSGSTLLANALGSVDGVAALGEVKLLFDRGLADHGSCACRLPLEECPVWSSALTATFGTIPNPVAAAALHAELSGLCRTRNLLRLLVPVFRSRMFSGVQWRLWSERMATLLINAGTAAGASSVVDSSRLPLFATLVTRDPRLEVRVVHLVRDPQAVAWSWQRETASQTSDGFGQQMERFSTFKTACMWLVSNTVIPALWRGDSRLVVRYEDLIADPGGQLARVGDFCGIQDAHTVIREQGILMADSHAVAGNPNRGRTGVVRLRADDQWRTQMPRRDRLIVRLVTIPCRRLYDY